MRISQLVMVAILLLLCLHLIAFWFGIIFISWVCVSFAILVSCDAFKFFASHQQFTFGMLLIAVVMQCAWFLICAGRMDDEVHLLLIRLEQFLRKKFFPSMAIVSFELVLLMVLLGWIWGITSMLNGLRGTP